jgi:hypothetical protein
VALPPLTVLTVKVKHKDKIEENERNLDCPAFYAATWTADIDESVNYFNKICF